MAEILELIKKRLISLLEVKIDEENLKIILLVRGEFQKSVILAEPHEVKDMLRILGGLKDIVSMEIEVDNNAREIKLKFENKDDLETVKIILDNLWDRTIHIFDELEKGNYDLLRGVGDFYD